MSSRDVPWVMILDVLLRSDGSSLSAEEKGTLEAWRFFFVMEKGPLKVVAPAGSEKGGLGESAARLADAFEAGIFKRVEKMALERGLFARARGFSQGQAASDQGMLIRGESVEVFEGVVCAGGEFAIMVREGSDRAEAVESAVGMMREALSDKGIATTLAGSMEMNCENGFVSGYSGAGSALSEVVSAAWSARDAMALESAAKTERSGQRRAGPSI